MPAAPFEPATRWQRLTAAGMRWFHSYANWLAGISWRRFLLLSLLLLIAAHILSTLVPGSWSVTEVRDAAHASQHRTPGRKPASGQLGGRPGDTDLMISIGEEGVSIRPMHRASAASSPEAASAAAAPGSVAGSAPERSAQGDPPRGQVEIRLPAGADSAQIRAAVEEARSAVVEAIEEAQQDSDDSPEDGPRRIVRTRLVRAGDSLNPLAFVFILMSAILKITYKGRIQAEVKAAAATETAESEQLKRQVLEARVAAMQAQVEPHFLFNTLASIDHLIETDPPRASVMQRNLIALLRASMPTMRENHPSAHTLGREMAVIRPYLEILKVRMEDRLKTQIDVPDGLLSAEFPPMMIQSLVENAIQHGLEPKPEGGTLTVRAQIVHGMLEVSVADTGLGFGKAATAGTGVGLTNIRQRLQLLFGRRGTMTVSENAPSGTVVTLTLPYQAQTPEGATP